MTLDTATIWTSIIIPIIIGPIFLFFKSMYDNFNNKNDERKLLKFNDHVERIRAKLQKFYWPIYLKLICVYQMNFNIPVKEGETFDNSSEIVIEVVIDNCDLFIEFVSCECY